jgi:hypothetical protein
MSVYLLATQTDMLFVLATKPRVTSSGPFLQEVYKGYADYILKNPFQILSQPFRSTKFVEVVDRAARRWGRL